MTTFIFSVQTELDFCLSKRFLIVFLLLTHPKAVISFSVTTSSSSSSSSNISTNNMLNIYLARHGQDEDNANGILNGHRDQPLTSIGLEQAKSVAEKIKQQGLTFDAVYSSPLQRAHRTAEIIYSAIQTNNNDRNKKNEKKVQVLDDLIERDFGIMEGVPTKEIVTRCSPDVLQTEKICYFLCPKGAETFPNLIERANKLLDHIYSLHPPSSSQSSSSILLVTHGDFGKMLYAAFYKLSWEEVLQQFHFGNSEVLLLSEESSPDQAHVFEIQQYNP